MASRQASYGWERWPETKSLDGKHYLCRWCHKQLEGRATAWCSQDCELEVIRRCRLDSIRGVIFARDGGCCVSCGLNLEDLEEALRNWDRLRDRISDQRKSILDHVERNKRFVLTAHWPYRSELVRALGFTGGGHLWEMNHRVGLAEGGDPIDPDNLETLCLKCHRKHTAELAARLAKAKRRQQKFNSKPAIA